MSEREIHATSPKELADLPSDFWEQASIVEPSPKQAISLRVDTDVLGPGGSSAPVVSVWFVRVGEQYPRFVTAYPGEPE